MLSLIDTRILDQDYIVWNVVPFLAVHAPTSILGRTDLDRKTGSNPVSGSDDRKSGHNITARPAKLSTRQLQVRHRTPGCWTIGRLPVSDRRPRYRVRDRLPQGHR